jgi:flavorubredoxin
VASKVAIQYLEDQVHRPFRSRAVKSGEELDLGTNPSSGVAHRFEFLSAPNLHWPDTIFSFDHGTGTLYTCDAFGLHYCSDELFDTDPGAIAPDFRFYYDCLMGPNARSVLQALKRMDALPEITTIAVGHGPLLRHHLGLWVGDYREWSSQRSAGEAYAAVCYVSQYGFCDRISQAIARGIGKADAQVQLVDLRATDAQELAALIGEASAVVVPTWPSHHDGELQAAIGTLLAALHRSSGWPATTPTAAMTNRSTVWPAGCEAWARRRVSPPCGSARCPMETIISAVRRPAPIWASCSPRPKPSRR